MTEIDTSRERLEILRRFDCADYLHMALLARAEKAEAERDTAWNDAIEAAADHFMDGYITDELNAFKKGTDQ